MLTTIVAPQSEPITVGEARVQVNAGQEADTHLKLCIAGARATCENRLRRALIRRTLEVSAPAFDEAGHRLPMPPVASITSVKYTDENGAEQTLDSSQYVLSDGVLLPAYGVTWPPPRTQPDALRIRYVAGYGTNPTDVPADVRTWLLMTVAFLYAQREAFDGTGRAKEIPSRFVDALLDPYIAFGWCA